MAILTMARHRFYKNDGSLNAGGKVWTYVAGTTTPAATYTSSDASVPNANPIILNSKGECDLWITGQIKVNVLESDDTQVTGWPVDNIGSGVANNDATMRWAGTAAGTANALTITPSPAIAAYVVGQSFIFKAGASPNSAATTIAISGLTPIAAQISGSALAGGEILAGKWYSIVLDSLTTCQVEPVASAALAGSASQAFSVAAAVSGSDAVNRDFGDSRYAGSNGSVGIAFYASNFLPAQGIQFPAVQSPSADANNLDDYEEGSWTPALTFATPGNLSVSYTFQTGRYTKVGRSVHLSFAIVTSTFTHTTASGALKITGIPFAAVSVQDSGGGCCTAFQGITKANYTQFAFVPAASQTFAYLYANGSGQNNTTTNAADMPTGTAKYIYGEITYQI